MDEETVLNPLDDAPLNQLEDIFVLPEELASDERIARWHAEMVRRLRDEAQGVTMKTAQYTLMERIAYFYANMRYQELHNPDISLRERMQNMTAWQSMLDMFNRMLEKNNDKLVNELSLKIQAILQERLQIISNKDERTQMRRALAEDFAAMNL